jgi:hypothetical protein
VTDVEGGGEHILGTHMEATKNLGITARNTRRRICQALAVWIFTDRNEQFSDRFFDSSRVVRPHNAIFIE